MATISARTDDGDSSLQTEIQIEFIATTANSLRLSADQRTIDPNGGRSLITATVTDPNGSFVKNKQINFSLSDNSGGQISSPTASTNSLGQASIAYTSSASSTAKDAVTITALVEDTPAVTDTINLSVSGKPVFISLGYSGKLAEINDVLYSQKISVLVTDITGNSVPGVELQLSVLPEYYVKGGFEPSYEEKVTCSSTECKTSYTFDSWVLDYDNTRTPKATYTLENGTPSPDPDNENRAISPKCVNEDLDNDGILDAGEDNNSNGQLDPSNVATVESSITTDVSGYAAINLVYHKSYANWVSVSINATASVAGTEHSRQFTGYLLPILDKELTKSAYHPLRTYSSPFGGSNDCSNTD